MENTFLSAATARVVPKPRFELTSVEPKAYSGLMLMHKQLSQSGLSLTHWDLINVRTSQLNGCSYCLMTHTQEALAHGETEQRLHALAAWQETSYFTAAERAILAFTEEVTLIARHHVSDAVYGEAVALLGESYLAQVLLAVVAMNAWNRLGIAQRKVPA
ncbi:carboxymuconolactone decarboxylase family protein [Hymenobacter negativus]|uniref:Carboxymuconolactone decarboxylase family protein n=1 Tax=Hymenobacter negativus TaxID=2795026 RepID=A0ABS3QN75_9BACT|nr:carboxymuconolactone decarboxylase family protein [Hymenobacter negativus]MBO2012234.1 carboxymuconolactone decarboxylase family protein [Hymenobacter negativus]